MDNLWPTDFGQDGEVNTPLTILHEQADFLGNGTQNIVTATIETVIDEENKLPFEHFFYIVAPVLNNYRYRLLTVTHDIEFYPLRVYTDNEILEENGESITVESDYRSRTNYIEVANDENFIGTLKMVFSSKKVRRIINNLMGQSKQRGGFTTNGSSC